MTHKTAQQLIAEAKQQISEITVHELRELQAQQAEFTLVDVRELNEWNLGHIPGASYIGRGVLESTVEQRIARDSQVVLYCQSGNRSALAALTMQQLGYTRVSSLAGGWRDWVGSGGEVAD
jgi:sulfur-carrier protein adenylyltransferase/sulfurtransferase